MAINTELVKAIALEVGVIAISAIATFLLPGLGGILLGGISQFLGDLGIEIANGSLPSDPTWFIVEFLAVFGPFFQEIKAARFESKLLRSLESGLVKVENQLQKIEDVGINAIEYLKKQFNYQFNSKSGLTPVVENEIREVENQEIFRGVLEQKGKHTKVTKKINSFTPNSKNPTSWIAGVGFKEKERLGLRIIKGDLVITYYENNHKRVGFVKKPISKIVLGRTSGGERKGSNRERYRSIKTSIDMSKVRLRKVVFRQADYYSDYLAFLKAHSWGGYYKRKWMIGLPGRKEQVNSLIVFGSLFRVYQKLKTLTTDGVDAVTNSKEFWKGKSKELFGQTRLGSKYNKVTGAFGKASSIKQNPFNEARAYTKGKLEQKRDFMRENKLHKKGGK